MTQFSIPPGGRVHLVGIGGSGMSSLAVVLHQSGFSVSGSDLADSSAVANLRARGMTITIGHAVASVDRADVVVRSSAVPDSDPEVVAALARGTTVVKHSQMLGWLSQTHRTLAVGGTSGKTSTTAMLATILIEAGCDPTAIVGGVLPSLGSGARLGESDLFVVEADEFDRRFLELHPEIAIVTNVEPDHLDYYGTFDAIKTAFESFVRAVPDEGWVILCADDPEAAALSGVWPDRTVTYGLSDDAEWRAAGISVNELGGSDFFVYAHETLIGQFRLRVPGRHNVANALAAAVAAGRVGVDFTLAAAALERFNGVERRLERKGEVGSIVVYDDYAHHPTKVRASLAALREHNSGRIVCLFQPHHYHRLSSLFDDFARAFVDADLVLITNVYAPAGRGPDRGQRTSADLARAISDPAAVYVGPLDAATEATLERLRPGDVVVTMGAGDVTEVGPALLDRLRERETSR